MSGPQAVLFSCHWNARRSASRRATFSESRNDSAYTDASPFGSSESQFHLKMSIKKCLYQGDSRQPIYINSHHSISDEEWLASILTCYGNHWKTTMNWLTASKIGDFHCRICKTGNPTYIHLCELTCFGIQGQRLNTFRLDLMKVDGL